MLLLFFYTPEIWECVCVREREFVVLDLSGKKTEAETEMRMR